MKPVLRKYWLAAIPGLWLTVFLLLPVAIVLKISLARAQLAVPPYSALFTWVDGKLEILATLNNYLLVLSDPVYLLAIADSVEIAAVSTLLCVLIGYPMAWAIAKAAPAKRNLLLVLVVMPSWVSFLIRIYAWMALLSNSGYINSVLMALGLIGEPIQMLHTDFAVYIGIVYAYLPFMILPIYTNLIRLDYRLVEAAQDLGATPWRAFWQVILPLSRTGVVTGCLLVFIPAIGEFVVPELLGGADTLMVGRLLWQEFFNNRDWPVASALTIVLLAVIVLPMVYWYRYRRAGTRAFALTAAPIEGATRP